MSRSNCLISTTHNFGSNRSKNLYLKIPYLQPSTGVLGTHRKSAVFELIRNGKRFPDGYFWQVELVSL